ncbi:MAG: hypothetical protein LBT84_01925, partial [Spirochaetia bacterium]|nr:hypothetical protein [Spirochaetia bacterium]
MEKRVIKQEAYYKIIWSPIEKYDRHLLTRLMPEMPGITGLFYKDDSGYAPVLFLECWRDGVRDGIKNFMDPIFIRYKEIRENIDMDEVYVSYTIIAA